MAKGEMSKKQKEAIKKADKESQAKKAVEDAKWVDNDKKLAKKNQRATDKSQSAAAAAERKAELKRQLAEEETATAAKSKEKAKPIKVTQYQLDQEAKKEREQRAVLEESRALEKKGIVVQNFEENMNKSEKADIDATTLEEALSGLDVKEQPRMTYADFEKTELPRLKQINRSLRGSQIKEICFKNWKKSPLNPQNQK